MDVRVFLAVLFALFFQLVKSQELSIPKNYPISDLTGFEYILHGEVHTAKPSVEDKINFLKFYYKEAGVRNLLIETGYASGYLYNRYLETGDESYICGDVFFNPYVEYRQFWRDLYAFNQAQEEKITVIGIDDNERIGTWFKALSVLFKDYRGNKHAILNVLRFSKSIDHPIDIDYEGGKRVKAEFVKDFKANPASYSPILGDQYVYLELIINNEKSEERNKNTNQYMIENLLAIYKKGLANNGAYFGQFGDAHLSSKTSLQRNLLYQFSVNENQILVVRPYYQNCESSYLVQVDNEWKSQTQTIESAKELFKHLSINTNMNIFQQEDKTNRLVILYKDSKSLIFNPAFCN